MTALRALLSGIVDYAGLFPPAALTLDKAFTRFVSHRGESPAWMLARFVVPAARLGELAAFAHQTPARPHPLSLLGTGGATGAAFLRATAADLEAMQTLSAAHPGFAALDAFEVRLPASVETEDDAAELAARTADLFRQAGYGGVPVFLELPFSPEGIASRPHVLAALATHNAGGRPRVGAKYRTGGVTADLFPTPETLAHALVDAHRAGVPFKATAGLHHPVRHYRDEVETHMHGFLNVFGGAVLLHVHDLDAEALTRLLREEDEAAFQISDKAFSYRDLSATTAQIEQARSSFAQSFGSCSFAEPVEDLRAMGWIGRGG